MSELSCPCGSAGSLSKCCGKLHGGAMPPSPEALMRSRYSAYAVGDVQYVLRTTHPDGPHHRRDRAVWEKEVQVFCSSTEFISLTVHGSGFDADMAGWVEFTANLRRGGADAGFRERSRFRPHQGRWAYLDGVHVSG